jgi:hypothetical protein
MNPPSKILDAEITPSQLKVKLDSGITVLMPLEHMPTLLLATEKERRIWKFLTTRFIGNHWIAT